MDNNIIAIIVAIIPPILGIILDNLKSRELGKELNRAIEITEDVFVEKINDQFINVIKHYENEINRVLALAFQGVNIDAIKDLEIQRLAFNKNGYRNIKDINKNNNQLELLSFCLRIFRWIFYIILVVALILIFLYYINKKYLPSLVIFILCGISIISIVCFLFTRIRILHKIERIEKEYGISQRI